MVAAELTVALVRGWSRPSCVGQERALRCLLDRVEVILDSYDLDLADDWRDRLEEQMFEDMDSDMRYQNAMDGFENDVERGQDPVVSRIAPEVLNPPASWEARWKPGGRVRSLGHRFIEQRLSGRVESVNILIRRFSRRSGGSFGLRSSVRSVVSTQVMQ